MINREGFMTKCKVSPCFKMSTSRMTLSVHSFHSWRPPGAVNKFTLDKKIKNNEKEKKNHNWYNRFDCICSA